MQILVSTPTCSRWRTRRLQGALLTKLHNIWLMTDFSLLSGFQSSAAEVTTFYRPTNLFVYSIPTKHIGPILHRFHRVTTLIIHHPATLSSQAQSLPFLQILSTVAFLFFFRTPRIPRTFTDTSEIRFYFLVLGLLFLPPLVFRSVL